MVKKQDNVYFYLTLLNENYAMPGLRAGTEEQIIKGMYLLEEGAKKTPRVNLLGSGTILRESIANVNSTATAASASSAPIAGGPIDQVSSTSAMPLAAQLSWKRQRIRPLRISRAASRVARLPCGSRSSAEVSSRSATTPPISACEELEGRPYAHVMRFQAIAPNNAERMTVGSTIDWSIIPLWTVFATAVPTTNAAEKLKKAAQLTAAKGFRTRVPTIVAIEFAVSWKPFVKSNASATTIVMTSSVTSTTGS